MQANGPFEEVIQHVFSKDVNFCELEEHPSEELGCYCFPI